MTMVAFIDGVALGFTVTFFSGFMIIIALKQYNERREREHDIERRLQNLESKVFFIEK